MSINKYTDKSVKSGNLDTFSSCNKSTQKLELGMPDHAYSKHNHETLEGFENDRSNRKQADIKTLSTVAADAAIEKLEPELKNLLALQVRNSNKSIASDINPDLNSSASSDQTNLESSFQLPTEIISYIDELLNTTQSSTFDNNLVDNFSIEDFDQLYNTSNPDMIYKDFTDIPMEQNDEYLQDMATTASIPSASYDERTSSTGSISDDTERDDRNRRGLKKSGGPVRKLAKFGNKQVIKYSDEYHDRRVKNNEAVKKSRMKAKEKQKETEGKMSLLAKENRELNDRVDLLMKELQVLKSLYKELNQDLPATAVRDLQRVNVR